MSSTPLSAPLYSTFGDDPDLGELVDMFVEEMPGRIETLLQLYNSADKDGLKRFAHQLKGSAGSYGFGQLTPTSARLEQSLKTNEPEEVIKQAVDELLDLCGRVRRGVAE
jgi:HPt (histidine-containing phosphotransfer) domain-containing protein